MPIKILRLLIPALAIAGVHLSIVYGYGLYALSFLSAAVAANAVLALVYGAGRGLVIGLAAIACILAAVQTAALLTISDLVRIVVLPPTLIHGWVAWIFGRTLLPGREPLIRRFSRLHRDHFPDELEGYTRRLTVAWTVLLSGLAVVSAGLGLLAPPAVWSWSVNVAMPAGCAVFFLAEHAYRGIAFRHLGGNSPIDTVRTLLSPKTWISP